MKRSIFILCVMIAVFTLSSYGQTPAITYQGKLSDASVAPTGTYELQFSLFDSETGGIQFGPTITNNAVAVVNGIFTVQLDFSPAIPFAFGFERWLQIAVHKPSDPPGFTILSPRQRITSAPFSQRATSASTADNVTGVVQVVNGGTGSSTQNFVDLSTDQTVAGNKAFAGNISAANLSGTNTGNVSLAAVGGTSNPNGATISGQVLTLQPASSTNPGLVTAGTQTIGGNKTFSGNLAVSGTLTATLGQSASTTHGTATLTVTTATFTLIPGLTQNITVPAGGLVFISSDGGTVTNSPTAQQGSTVDVALSVDGSNPETSGFGFRRLGPQNSNLASGFETWSMSLVLPLTPGNHTIQVQSRLLAGAAASVSGDANSALRGQLTVIILKP